MEQLVECRSRTADKLVGFCSFSFEWILLIFLRADKSRAIGISEFVDGFVGGSKATDVVKLSNESAIGKVVELSNESAIGKVVVELPNGSKAISKVVELSNGSRAISKVVELPNGSRAIGKVGFVKRKPRPASKIFWELLVAAIDCSAKDSGSDFLSWHSPRV